MAKLSLASPVVSVEPYRADGAAFRIRIRNPFGHPIHIGWLAALHPRPATGAVCRVEVDGWEMNPRAVRRRLGVFLDAGREMTIAFKAGGDSLAPVVLALGWGRRRATLWPRLPKLVLRTGAQMGALTGQAAQDQDALRPIIFRIPPRARRVAAARPAWPRLTPSLGYREDSTTASRRSPSGGRAHRWPAPDPWLRIRLSGG